MNTTPIKATAGSLITGLSEVLFANINFLEETSSLDTVHVEVVEQISEIFKLEADWLSLDAEYSGSGLFQSWHWNKEFLNHCQENSGVEPFVLTARDNEGKLIGLLPLAKQRRKFRTCLTGLSEPYQQYTEMLLTGDHDPQALFKKWLPKIKASGVDYIHLGQVRSDGNLSKAMKGLVGPSGEQDAAPFVDLSNSDSFEDYYQSIKPKTRKNMRNAHNRLEKTAPVTHHTYESGSGLSKVITNVYEQREAWLERMGLTSRAFNDDDFNKFITRFKTSKKDGLQFMGTSLMHGEHPIAQQLGFIHKGCYYAYMSGWDNEYQQSSPGKAHLGEVLKVCCEKGLVKADFMIPAVPYKFTWATGSVVVADYVVPFSASGFMYNAFWLKLLRPLAKKVAYKLPSSFRAKLFKSLKRKSAN